MARSLDAVFQTDLPKARRTGFGKCLNVNERTALALTQGRERFSFRKLSGVDHHRHVHTVEISAVNELDLAAEIFDDALFP